MMITGSDKNKPILLLHKAHNKLCLSINYYNIVPAIVTLKHLNIGLVYLRVDGIPA